MKTEITTDSMRIEVAELIRSLSLKRGKALVVSHHNPDGDALGSVLALHHFFLSIGIESYCALPNAFPPFLEWLPGSDNILNYAENPQPVKGLMPGLDAIFCLDFNALHRIHDLGHAVNDSIATKVMIDHHPNPSDEFNISFSNTDTSSTSELIFWLIMSIAGEQGFSRQIAEALYVGIMTDTGSFSFACDKASTFEAISILIRAGGISPERIHRLVYDTYSENRMRLLGYCLSEKMVVIPELQAAYISLQKDELDKFAYRQGDTEGVVNFALSIKGVKVAALFTERTNHIRISFRSKGDFAVNQIARDHYEGGGHRNAAGGNSYLPMKESLLRFTELLEMYKDEILGSSDS